MRTESENAAQTYADGLSNMSNGYVGIAVRLAFWALRTAGWIGGLVYLVRSW